MIPFTLSSKRLADWTLRHFETVVTANSEESVGLELKERLPLNKDAKGWEEKRQLHSSERDGLAKEIVALANMYGGYLLIGVRESRDHPKRAQDLSDPLSNVHTLTDRLRDSLSAIIDPPILGLEIKAIEIAETDKEAAAGYIAIHVPKSTSSPHGFGTPTQAYVRRADKSEPMTMRDMQDRFFESLTSRQHIEREFERFSLKNQMHMVASNTIATSITIVPISPVSIEAPTTVMNSHDWHAFLPSYESDITASFAHSPRSSRWRPTAFGTQAGSEDIGERSWKWSIDEQGTMNVSGTRQGRPTSTQLDTSTTEVVDVEVHPFWITVAIRDLISTKHALQQMIQWPDIQWLLRVEVWAPNAKIWVRTHRDWGDFERSDLTNIVSTRPLPFSSPFDREPMNRIENKVLNCFGFDANPFGEVLNFVMKN